jgi:hypothetical protein
VSRNLLLKLSVVIVTLGTAVVVSTIAQPGPRDPVAEQVNMTRPDFDRVFSDAESVNLSYTDVDREALRQIGLKRIEERRSGP